MHLLRRRRIALLVAGQAVNGIGSWCAFVAMWGFATQRFGTGPLGLAALGLAFTLPPLVLGPAAGIAIDRVGPKRVMVVADLAAAGVALALMFAGSMAALLVGASLLGAAKAFTEPAFSSLPPRIVDPEDLAPANALLAMAGQSSIAFGPLLAAAAIALWGVQAAFVIDALTFLVGVAVLLPFHVGAVRRVAGARLRDDLRDGLRVVRHRPRLRLLLGTAATVYLIWGAFVVVEPLYVREVLGGSPTVLALLQATFGIGLLATGALLARFSPCVTRVRVVAGATLASGCAAALYVGTSVPAVAFGAILCWGVATALFTVPMRTLVQREAPTEAHGRVFAIDGTLNSGGHLVALPVAGLAAGVAGVQAAGVALAAVPVLGGLVSLWRGRAEEPVAA